MEQLTTGSIGHLIGTCAANIVQADTMSKNEAVERTIKAFEAGNFDLATEVGLIGMDTPLKIAMNAPKAILMPLNPIVISDATIDISMDISSHTESETTVDSDETVEGKASFGIGLFKASMSVKAHVGVHHSNKRSTDKRSSCAVHIEMTQGEAAEGAMRLLDGMLLAVDKAMDMNLQLIDVEADILRNQALGDGSDAADDSDADDSGNATGNGSNGSGFSDDDADSEL